MKIVAGNGFNTNNYKLLDIKQIKGKQENLRMFVNSPTRIGEKISSKDFDELRAIFIDIEPSKEMKQIINSSKKFDFKSWNKKVEDEIDKLIDVLEYNYGKKPTYIFNTGAGIQILLSLDKPKAKKNIKKKDMIAYGFIFKLLQLHLSDYFEIDKAIYDISDTKSFWTRISPRLAKVPVLQSVKKYKDEFNKKGLKYKSKIFCIKGDIDSRFKLSEMIVKEYDFLAQTVFRFQVDGLPKSRLDSIADITRILIEDGGKDNNEKVNNISCLFPNHPDKNPSAVFFKDSGTYFCSSCNKSMMLSEIYYLTTGEDLTLSDEKLLFEKLPEYLIRYSYSEDGNIYHFKTSKSSFSIHIDQWKDNDLVKILSQNMILGFKGGNFKNKVLDGVIIKCDNKEVPLVRIEKKGFYDKKIIINSKNSYKKNKYPEVIKGERVMVEKFGSLLNLVVEDELPANHSNDCLTIYAEMNRISNNEYNANVFALLFTSLLMERFERSYKIHPIIYVHGFRDTGKTSMVEFMLSLITTDYGKLEPGITSAYTMLMSMSNTDYMPVLIDEAAKFLSKQDGSVIQILKDIATNGGKHIKGKPGGIDSYSLKATPVLVNEYRIDTLDPSFYQRCIELDLNVFDKINLDMTADFNELLRVDKTSVLFEMIKFMENYKVDFKQVNQYLRKNIDKKFSIDNIDGKKKFSTMLYSTGLLLSYNFMIEKKFSVNENNMSTHINKYMKSEIVNNSSEYRIIAIAEQLMQLLEINLRFKASLIESRIQVVRYGDTMIFTTSMKMLENIGWRNKHLLGEVRSNTKRVVALNGKQFQSNIVIAIEKDEGLSFLDNLREVTKNGDVTKNIDRIVISFNKGNQLIDEDENGL